MRHQGLVQKKTSRDDVKCQSLFSRSSCYFLYLGTGKGRLTLVDLTQSWSLTWFIFKKKELERIVRDRHWKTKGRNVLKMWRIPVTADRSEWIWVDLHIFTEVSIRQLETSRLFFQFQLLIQKGMNEGWYVSSVGPTLYRNYLERLTFSCSYCFLPFLYAAKKKMLMLKYNNQNQVWFSLILFVIFFLIYWFVFTIALLAMKWWESSFGLFFFLTETSIKTEREKEKLANCQQLTLSTCKTKCSRSLQRHFNIDFCYEDFFQCAPGLVKLCQQGPFALFI